VENVRNVDVPVAAERLPRVVLDRPRQRVGAGVEHQDGGTVGVDELASDDGVGRVSGDRGERFAEPRAQFFQRSAVAGDPDDRRARLAQGDGDATAEAPAGPGHQRRRAC
jgi:hypothetical protein